MVVTEVMVALPETSKSWGRYKEAVVVGVIQGEAPSKVPPILSVVVDCQAWLPLPTSSTAHAQAEPFHLRISLVAQAPKAMVVEAFSLVSNKELNAHQVLVELKELFQLVAT